MTVLYRALWNTKNTRDPEVAVAAAREVLTAWASDGAQVEPLPDGDYEFGANRVSVRNVDLGAERGLIFARSEDHNVGHSATTWTTTSRVVSGADTTQFWVEVDMEADDPLRKVQIGRPRAVDELLSIEGAAWLGASELTLGVFNVGPDQVTELVSLIRNRERSLPVIVFTEPSGVDQASLRKRADATARRAAGVCSVAFLTAEAAEVLNAQMGTLGVWGGAIRTYLPAPADSAADGWRHRYIPYYRVLQTDVGLIDRLVASVAQLSARRRPDPVFKRLAAAVEETPPLLLLERLEAVEFDLDLAREEADERSAEIARVNGRYARLVTALRERGMDEVVYETHDEPVGADALPDTAQDLSDAVLSAQQHLAELLSVPDEALREPEGIDSAPNSGATANTTWRGLRALAAYSAAKRRGSQGDFWQWCERGEPDSWPATDKKLSMTESETLQKNRKLMQSRVFPVEPALDASQKRTMLAHLKVNEGGGDLAVRVYFYDDTMGSTRKVHVGFIGPHYLVPNSKA